MALTPITAMHRRAGAALAPDGIPLHYGDIPGEYRAALESAVLLDRSHEGRLRLTGRDRAALLHRMSTNDLEHLAPDEGRATLFTTANARIIDRIEAYNDGESLLLLAGPGRAEPLRAMLQRNIFFNDDAALVPLNDETAAFALHGPHADAIAEALHPGARALPVLHRLSAQIADTPIVLTRRKPYVGGHWALIVPADGAESVWLAVLRIGEAHGLRASGGLTYNTLRIRAGIPGTGRELSGDYIPLEVGLWDEVSFTKGCYTGQEIIARMESRNRLAKTLVRLTLSAYADSPAPLYAAGRPAGTLSSSVTDPDGVVWAMGVVKTAQAVVGTRLHVGAADAAVTATVGQRLGVQPAGVQAEDS